MFCFKLESHQTVELLPSVVWTSQSTLAQRMFAYFARLSPCAKMQSVTLTRDDQIVDFYYPILSFCTRKAEVLNSLIINTTAKANDTTDCYALKMITVVIETFARCQLYRLLWP